MARVTDEWVKWVEEISDPTLLKKITVDPMRLQALCREVLAARRMRDAWERFVTESDPHGELGHAEAAARIEYDRARAGEE